ncbi:MAG: EcsC family protein [Bacteroidota bacterium]
MAKLNSTELKVLQDVEGWKEDGPGFLNLATHMMTKPLVWAADKLIPESASEKMGEVSDTIVARIQDLSQWTVSEEEVLQSTKEFEIDSETILELKKASVFDLIHVSEEFGKFNTRLAIAEGFGTGLLGWPGLLADLPALFTLCFRLIYQNALCFGYQLDEPTEEHESFEIGYMLRVFKIATSSSFDGKTKGLAELKAFEEQHPNGVHWVGGDFTRKQIGKTAAVNLSRMLINQILKETLARKAITSIPGVGAVLTAGFNYYYVNDVAKTASMIYRERFLLDKRGRKKIVNIAID